MAKWFQNLKLPRFSLLMTPDTISDVVTTTYGFHIIKMIDKTPAQKLDYAKVADKIKDFLLQQQTQKLAPAYLDNLKKGANIEILDSDLKATTVTPETLP